MSRDATGYNVLFTANEEDVDTDMENGSRNLQAKQKQ